MVSDTIFVATQNHYKVRDAEWATGLERAALMRLWPAGIQGLTHTGGALSRRSPTLYWGASLSGDGIWVETGAFPCRAACVIKHRVVGKLACAACHCFTPNAVSPHLPFFLPSQLRENSFIKKIFCIFFDTSRPRKQKLPWKETHQNVTIPCGRGSSDGTVCIGSRSGDGGVADASVMEENAHGNKKNNLSRQIQQKMKKNGRKKWKKKNTESNQSIKWIRIAIQ